MTSGELKKGMILFRKELPLVGNGNAIMFIILIENVPSEWTWRTITIYKNYRYDRIYLDDFWSDSWLRRECSSIHKF